MFDHVVFGATDYEASKAFYLKALAPLGLAVVSEGALGIEMSADGKTSLCLRPGERNPAQTAVQFALSHAAITSAVMGIRTHAQLKEAVAAMKLPFLSANEMEGLRSSAPLNLYTEHR